MYADYISVAGAGFGINPLSLNVIAGSGRTLWFFGVATIRRS
jgi:hypothetical protein